MAMLLPLVLVSCHNKKDDSTDTNYMSGTLTFSIPDFVGKGETLTLTPTGITTPTSGIGYMEQYQRYHEDEGRHG